MTNVLLNNAGYEKQNTVCLADFFTRPPGRASLLFVWFFQPVGLATSLTHRPGWYGIQRTLEFGQDDVLSWILIPLLGFTFAGCALNAIIYGLMPPEKWHAKFNAGFASSERADTSNWLTIFGAAAALLMGTTILMASIVFSFQRYFEFQIEAARTISQPSEATDGNKP